ncbi:hypothetical protein Nepgr_020415 [Nepenthes gracilis]|uniref:Uncharacterized protein n=1 Tax=Nepenthes gracilis TaxID=150966 RepID=A0AAD3SXK7_NEPGR|nr:hypothetical protein Nepgr_020415 [Nepenthes gracilis]
MFWFTARCWMNHGTNVLQVEVDGWGSSLCSVLSTLLLVATGTFCRRLARLWVVRAILLLRFHLMGPWCFGSAIPASCFMATVVTLVMAVVVQLGCDWLRCKCNCRHFSALLAKLPIAFARFSLWKMAGLGCGWMGLAKVDGDADVASFRFCLIADTAFGVAVAADADVLVLS